MEVELKHIFNYDKKFAKNCKNFNCPFWEKLGKCLENILFSCINGYEMKWNILIYNKRKKYVLYNKKNLQMHNFL